MPDQTHIEQFMIEILSMQVNSKYLRHDFTC